MANPSVYPGFRGIAIIDFKNIRVSDFSVNPNQSIEFYNHVIGLNDTIPNTASVKGEVPGTIQTQRKYLRPNPISIQGGMSFPASVNNSGIVNFYDIFNYAKYGDYFDVTYKHFCQKGRKYLNCRVGSFSFKATASDIVQIQADIGCKDMVNADSVTTYTTAEKLVTWDEVYMTWSGDMGGLSSTNAIQGIEFSINNNLQNIYTANPNPSSSDPYKKLLPKDLRLGMQEVTGSLAIYIKSGRDFMDQLTGAGVINLHCTSSFSTEINVIMQPKQMQGTVGAAVINVPFIGVDKAFGA